MPRVHVRLASVWALSLALAGAAHAQAPAGASGTPLVTALPADSLPAFPSAPVRAWQVGLLRGDRLQHASLSFALGAAWTLAFRDAAAGAGTALALGALKELWDARRGGADGVDLVADALGATLGAIAARPGTIDAR